MEQGPQNRRFTIALRGSDLPPLPSPPTLSPPTPTALHAAVESFLPLPPPPNLPSIPILATHIYRAASHPDAATAVRRILAAHALPRDTAHVQTLLAAAQLIPTSPAPHDIVAWDHYASADFSAALVRGGAARYVPTVALPDDEAPSSPAISAPSVDPSWLRNRCARLAAVSSGDGLSAAEMAVSVLSLLTNPAHTDAHLQGDLFDAFMGDFDAVADVLARRDGLVAAADAVMADCARAEEGPASAGSAVRGARGVGGRERNDRMRPGVAAQITVRDARVEAEERERRRVEQRLVRSGVIRGGRGEGEATAGSALGGSAYEERQRNFPGVLVEGDSVIGEVDRVGLPRGSTREVGKGYEEIFVPPPSAGASVLTELVEVSDALKEHPELLGAMKGVATLNRLQSTVYPMAFRTDENLLVCAPTGAGKTNVALLTIFREIVAVKRRVQRDFKVVYVAPMKALAAEVTEKFGKRLGPLGLRVREFTGDMSLSRVEAMETHVLVTTPEKWDVVTRKSGSELGDAVTLFIVDEIHLLHDERGAVLESIVARTLRLSETAQKQIRLVGLSATLPNYADVGSFMRVNPEKGLFHFDASHRPVPLSQTFIGISEGGQSNSSDARRRREAKMHEMAWKKVKDSLQRGHQAMIFVHSRKGTALAAREMLSRAAQDAVEDIFLGGEGKKKEKRPLGQKADEGDAAAVMPSWASREISKSKSSDIRELCARGVGIHNAGLPRPDRKLVEKLFGEGVIRLLCCTATLAWGVNLPARTVVIMGTEVYNAEKGGFVQLGMLDVMQIFGRAGRPQFDTEGEGTIITMHEHLGKYLSLLTSSVPIESKLGASASRLADHLNAEVVSGTVSSIGEGVRWLNYTYLSVRMAQNPLVYGIDWAEVEADFGLHSRRATLIEQASKALDDARMCRYDPRTGALAPTDVGRISSHFYVSHETIVLWNELLGNLSLEPAVTDEDWEEVYSTVLHAVACATEFEQMRSRQEEAEELDYLTREACPIPLKSGSETREGKVSILLQAHISRANIRMSDLSYIIQSSTRLLRALFELSLRRRLPSMSLASLELARASESRIWPFQHPLWQFTYSSRRVAGMLIRPETVATIEAGGDKGTVEQLRNATKEELAVLIRAPKMAMTVQRVVKAIPILDIDSVRVAPLNRTVLQIDVSLVPNFRWHDAVHGNAEAWWMWVEDQEEDTVYHSQKILLTKRQVGSLRGDGHDGSRESSGRSFDYSFSVPVFDPPSTHYWVRVESDRWHTGGGSSACLSLIDMDLPVEENVTSDLLDLRPLSVHSSLTEEEAPVFRSKFSHFNPLQTQAFHIARHTDENMLISAPSGTGKWVIAELAILRALSASPQSVVVYIAADWGTLLLRFNRWRRLEFFSNRVVKLLDSSCVQEGRSFSLGPGLLLTTGTLWKEFSQTWEDDAIRRSISLLVFDDLHLLSAPSYRSAEVVITKLRNATERDASRQRPTPRVVGLSEAIANAGQLGDWLGVRRPAGLFAFGENVRQVQRELQVIGVAGDRYTSRMHSINRTLFSMIQRYSPKKPVLIYVSSRKQTLVTAESLDNLASVEGNRETFSTPSSQPDPSAAKELAAVSDFGLRRSLSYGVGLYHSGLSHRDREAVEVLFQSGYIRVVIATFDMARKVSWPSHLVVVKGTEVYRPKERRYEDVSVSDIVSMTGQCGRPGVDTLCYSIVFVHEPKKTLFKKLLHEALPVESGLHAVFEAVLMSEISQGRVRSLKEGVAFLMCTFMYNRLQSNPAYYGIRRSDGKSDSTRNRAGGNKMVRNSLEWCVEFVGSQLKSLLEEGCIDLMDDDVVIATPLGHICSSYDLQPQSGSSLRRMLKRRIGIEGIVNEMSTVGEVASFVVGHEESGAWGRMSECIAEKYSAAKLFRNKEIAMKELGLVRTADSLETRSKAVCHSVLAFGSSEGSDLGIDFAKIHSTLERLVAAGLDLAAESGRLSTIQELVRVSQSLYQGLLPTDDFWVVSGYQDKRLAAKGRQHGFNSIVDVRRDEAAFHSFVAKNADDEAQRSGVLRWLGRYPGLRVAGQRLSEARNQVAVTVDIQRSVSMGREGCETQSRACRKRRGGFVVVIGSLGKDAAYAVRRMSDVVGTSGQVSVSMDIGDCQEEDLFVWVMSDVSVGVQSKAAVRG